MSGLLKIEQTEISVFFQMLHLKNLKEQRNLKKYKKKRKMNVSS